MNQHGALDTSTSVQIMELLKKISKNKLIIMVTHNPEIAEKYSSRIVKVVDGKVVDDSNPYPLKEKKKEKKSRAKSGKTSMSFFTALSLSLNNLLTKKGRTFLTAFAGSIGIIGIALILSLSSGVSNYISKVEEDTLSSYPITIEDATVDMTSMMSALLGENKSETIHENGKIYSKNIMTDMLKSMSTEVEINNLKEFKKYLDSENNTIRLNSNDIQYSYNLKLNLYKNNTDEIVKVNPSTVMKSMGMEEMAKMSENSPISSMSSTDVFQELLNNDELLKSQYDIIAGHLPSKYNEVVLIVNNNNEITDYTLYSLGLKDQKELEEKLNKIKNGEEINAVDEVSYTYEDILNLSFKLLLNTDYYQKENNIWVDKSEDNSYMKDKISNAEEIKVVGILRQNEETISNETSGIIGYTKELKEYVINKINNTDIVNEQKSDENVNIFTGLGFPETTTASTKFDYNSLSDEQKQYMSSMSQEELSKLVQVYSENANASYENNLEKLGIVDLDTPSAINIYPINFESKEAISNAIEEYNTMKKNEGNEKDTISYNDLIGLMMNSVTSIIDVISYVLIAFVSISLIVSSIMIGIITYISVLERTKEIGILRAMGASKKDISRVFNAETFIVGISAGILGILVTILLNIPINLIIKSAVGISGIASLPVIGAIILIAISMILTVIAGLIPAKMASKKDPVIALRTE